MRWTSSNNFQCLSRFSRVVVTSMKSLDLSNCGLSVSDCGDADSLRQAVLAAAATAGKKRPSLEDTTHLYLEGNGITALPIWAVLEVFPNLVWLDLRNNRIQSLGGNVDFEDRSLAAAACKADKHLRIQMRVPTGQGASSSHHQAPTSDYDEESLSNSSSPSPSPAKTFAVKTSCVQTNACQQSDCSTSFRITATDKTSVNQTPCDLTFPVQKNNGHQADRPASVKVTVTDKTSAVQTPSGQTSIFGKSDVQKSDSPTSDHGTVTDETSADQTPSGQKSIGGKSAGQKSDSPTSDHGTVTDETSAVQTPSDRTFACRPAAVTPALHLRGILLQNNQLTRRPWILDQPEYFPCLKIICTDGNPLIKECSSSSSEEAASTTVRRERNGKKYLKPSGGGEKSKKCESEQDSGVASQEEDCGGSLTTPPMGKCSRGCTSCDRRQEEGMWRRPDIEKHLPRLGNNHASSPGKKHKRRRMKKNVLDLYEGRKIIKQEVAACQCSGGAAGGASAKIRKLLKHKTWLRLVGCKKTRGGVWSSEILQWECQGPDQDEVNFSTQQQRALRAERKVREEISGQLQRVKDLEVLKAWRQMYRRQSHESVWNSVPKEQRPGAATYNPTTLPYGAERDRRLPKPRDVRFDACPPSDHDRAVDALMAEMDRVLARRPCTTSYVDDHAIPHDGGMQPVQPRELLQSAREMRRVGGQINKALVKSNNKASTTANPP